MAGVIESYLDELARHLSHDPALARRMRAEIADHLAEALGDMPSEAAAAAAVARMGPARAIAATLLTDRAGRAADRTWLALLVALLATFVAMRLRTLWLPPLAQDGTLAGLAAPLVDRWGFVAAILAGAGGYWLVRRAPSPGPSRIVGTAAGLALAALAASVAAGLLRIGLAAGWTGAPATVLIATLGECVVVGLLMAQVLALRRQRRRAESLAAG